MGPGEKFRLLIGSWQNAFKNDNKPGWEKPFCHIYRKASVVRAKAPNQEEASAVLFDSILL